MALIKPDMIPDEVVEAACRAYTSIMLEVAPESAISEAIATAINAWPRAMVISYAHLGECDWLRLPLPQEPRDE